jgi:hypothetical protein
MLQAGVDSMSYLITWQGSQPYSFSFSACTIIAAAPAAACLLFCCRLVSAA